MIFALKNDEGDGERACAKAGPEPVSFSTACCDEPTDRRLDVATGGCFLPRLSLQPVTLQSGMTANDAQGSLTPEHFLSDDTPGDGSP